MNLVGYLSRGGVSASYDLRLTKMAADKGWWTMYGVNGSSGIRPLTYPEEYCAENA